jgi:hypothetical protein
MLLSGMSDLTTVRAAPESIRKSSAGDVRLVSIKHIDTSECHGFVELDDEALLLLKHLSNVWP